MATLEQLQAEAAELYPYPKRGFFVQEEVDRERAAHVQAKTISADEYADVLRDVHHELVECSREGQVDIEVHGDPDPYASGSVEDRLARAVMGVLGVHIQEADDDDS
ncbi:hypothetical protein [Nesterenkonia rhizosphaerae]|uniref:Uncharacterized protein n=1 Tax=Nesterenkonia rhizosphaerae TaxID=1348272 RepID=A0ABP9G1C7_9MICC